MARDLHSTSEHRKQLTHDFWNVYNYIFKRTEPLEAMFKESNELGEENAVDKAKANKRRRKEMHKRSS